MPSGLFPRLSIMMFLQYAIWGAWLPLFWGFMATVRGFEDSQIGMLFAVGAVGALFAPFIAGQIADRYFPTEKFLGISHIVGGCLVFWLARLESYEALLAFAFLYSLIYAPTLPLTNSLAFHHLPDRNRDFGKVRVWGTVGWIVVGIAVGQWRFRMVDSNLSSDALTLAYEKLSADAFTLSAVLGILMGVFCFFLPHTPPQPGKEKLAWKEAFSEVMRDRRLIVLFSLCLPMSCIHQFYFARTSQFLTSQKITTEGITSIFGIGSGPMTIGQIAEIVVLALMPILLVKMGKKTLMIIGLLAYIGRFAAFAYADSNPVILAALALHGLCFGGFFFVAFILVDERTSTDVRASAQGLLNLIIVGIGTILGNLFAGWVGSWASVTTVVNGQKTITMDWDKLWSVPLYASAAVLAILILFYPSGRDQKGA